MASIKVLLQSVFRKVVELAIVILICILMLDGIIYFTFRNPDSVPSSLASLMRIVNISAARPQPAYDPACSVYDFEVNYRFKSGQCRHQSWEFDVTIRGNSKGFPDDEASLTAPKIVILGDSYAAGWGVEQGQSFPSHLERISGKRVLVAAAPSYATGRELALLDDMDLSAVETVIIQYSENDAFENFEVFKNEGIAPIHHMVYRSISKTNLKRKRYLQQPYFPGKYIHLVYLAFQQPTAPALPSNDSKAEHLLGIIERSKLADMNDVPIFIVSIYESHKSDQAVIDAVNKRLYASKNSNTNNLHNRIKTLPTTLHLTGQDYFILDDHLRPSGHRKVAELLNDSLSQ